MPDHFVCAQSHENPCCPNEYKPLVNLALWVKYVGSTGTGNPHRHFFRFVEANHRQFDRNDLFNEKTLEKEFKPGFGEEAFAEEYVAIMALSGQEPGETMYDLLKEACFLFESFQIIPRTRIHRQRDKLEGVMQEATLEASEEVEDSADRINHMFYDLFLKLFKKSTQILHTISEFFESGDADIVLAANECSAEVIDTTRRIANAWTQKEIGQAVANVMHFALKVTKSPLQSHRLFKPEFVAQWYENLQIFLDIRQIPSADSYEAGRIFHTNLQIALCLSVNGINSLAASRMVCDLMDGEDFRPPWYYSELGPTCKTFTTYIERDFAPLKAVDPVVFHHWMNDLAPRVVFKRFILDLWSSMPAGGRLEKWATAKTTSAFAWTQVLKMFTTWHLNSARCIDAAEDGVADAATYRHLFTEDWFSTFGNFVTRESDQTSVADLAFLTLVVGTDYHTMYDLPTMVFSDSRGREDHSIKLWELWDPESHRNKNPEHEYLHATISYPVAASVHQHQVPFDQAPQAQLSHRFKTWDPSFVITLYYQLFMYYQYEGGARMPDSASAVLHRTETPVIKMMNAWESSPVVSARGANCSWTHAYRIASLTKVRKAIEQAEQERQEAEHARRQAQKQAEEAERQAQQAQRDAKQLSLVTGALREWLDDKPPSVLQLKLDLDDIDGGKTPMPFTKSDEWEALNEVLRINPKDTNIIELTELETSLTASIKAMEYKHTLQRGAAVIIKHAVSNKIQEMIGRGPEMHENPGASVRDTQRSPEVVTVAPHGEAAPDPATLLRQYTPIAPTHAHEERNSLEDIQGEKVSPNLMRATHGDTEPRQATLLQTHTPMATALDHASDRQVPGGKLREMPHEAAHGSSPGGESSVFEFGGTPVTLGGDQRVPKTVPRTRRTGMRPRRQTRRNTPVVDTTPKPSMPYGSAELPSLDGDEPKQTTLLQNYTPMVTQEWHRGQTLQYIPTEEAVTVVQKDLDPPNEPYYTIKFIDTGSERQVLGGKLREMPHEAAHGSSPGGESSVFEFGGTPVTLGGDQRVPKTVPRTRRTGMRPRRQKPRNKPVHIEPVHTKPPSSDSDEL